MNCSDYFDKLLIYWDCHTQPSQQYQRLQPPTFSMHSHRKPLIKREQPELMQCSVFVSCTYQPLCYWSRSSSASTGISLNCRFFSENYTEEARQVLSHANHPKLGYSYAIVGINLTEMAYSLLKGGALKPHFYNTVQGTPELKHFHQLYCYLAYEFDKFWVAEEPESIMHFNQYREKFHDIVKTHLQDPDVTLTLTISSGKN